MYGCMHAPSLACTIRNSIRQRVNYYYILLSCVYYSAVSSSQHVFILPPLDHILFTRILYSVRFSMCVSC